MEPIIEVKDLTKIYGKDSKAVDRLNFSVQPGEIFGFLGPNGAGKTTTILMLISVLQPSEGTAKVCGYDIIRESKAVRKSIGYSSQDIIADELLTGRENLELIGRLQGVPSRILKTRIDHLLELLDLKDKANDYVMTYSGGMRKKLDIAGALVHEPSLMFLDEPTLGLDPRSRRAIWKYIQELNGEKGLTIFLTSHYLDEVDALADSVAIIDRGQLKAIGSPEELKDSIGKDGEKRPSLDDVFSKFTGHILTDEQEGYQSERMRRVRAGWRG